MAYLGNAIGVESQRLVTTFTATASQTDFDPSGGYTLGYVDVYLNGVKLVDGTDYTADDGVTVTLTTGASLNDSVEIVTYTPRGLSDGYTKAEADAKYTTQENFTSTGIDDNATSTAITIDSNENVGIGTSSPSDELHITDATPFIRIEGTNGTGAYHRIGSSASNSQTLSIECDTGDTAANSAITFDIDASEAMRLDSSGNLLVGTTTASYTVAGTVFYGVDGFSSTRANNQVGLLNRTGSDGAILNFRKDGSTVGSIGTKSGTLYTGNGDTGLGFVGAYDEVFPCDGSGANRDDAINLGGAGARFKDLYLSGGVVFGSTGGAVTSKTLDDYEEGNFTPTFGGLTMANINDARYTKIGRIVYIHCDVTTPATGSTSEGYITLPFADHSEFNGGGAIEYTTNSSATVVGIGVNGVKFRSSVTEGSLTFANLQSSRFIFTLMYEVA